MSAAFEVSPDDPQGVADAIRRAAEGATVHVVREGAPVADIVPAQPADADRRARGRQIEARQRGSGPVDRGLPSALLRAGMAVAGRRGHPP